MLQIRHPSMTAQIFLIFEYGVFYDFLSLLFFKQLKYKKILMDLEFLNLMVACCQCTRRGCMQFFPPNVTAQILLVSEMWLYTFGFAKLPPKFDKK